MSIMRGTGAWPLGFNRGPKTTRARIGGQVISLRSALRLVLHSNVAYLPHITWEPHAPPEFERNCRPKLLLAVETVLHWQLQSPRLL